VSEARAYLDAGLAFVVRDFKVMMSYRTRWVTQLLTTFFSLTLFYYISRLVTVGQFSSQDAYYAFAVIGLVILQILNSTLQTPPMSLRQELVAGTFERIVLSPFGAVAGIGGMLLFPFAYALFTSLVMLAFASLVFSVPVEWATAPLAIPVAFLGAFSFAPFGLLLLSVVLLVKQALGGATWVVALISLIAGLYFPVSLLPDWVEWASNVQPFTPAVELLRNLLVGTPLNDAAWLSLVKLIGFGAVLFPLSVWAVSAAVRASRQRGTIIEY
jgi:ABC-2 type transport system permease protein